MRVGGEGMPFSPVATSNHARIVSTSDGSHAKAVFYDEHDALFLVLCRSIAANHVSHRLSFAMIVRRRLITQIVIGCGDGNH